MDKAEHLRQTLEYLRQQIQKKLDEMRPLQIAASQLEKELGEQPQMPEPHEISVSVSDSMTFSDSVTAAVTPSSAQVRPDEFFSMSQSDAAKAYLKKIGRAVSLDQLLEGLRRGGAEVGGVNPKRTLYVSLMRNPLREFVVPSENHIGLRSFYPGLPKAVKPNWTGPRKTKKQKGTKKAGANKAKNKKEPNPVTLAIRNILAFGAKSRKELLADVREKLGDQIPEVRITGALRSKEFKEVGGKFQLAG